MSANSLLTQTPLTPGFMVVHANRLEDLRGLAVEWMRKHPLAPLENETILVQSNGIGQWLKLALAEDPAGHSGGIERHAPRALSMAGLPHGADPADP